MKGGHDIEYLCHANIMKTFYNKEKNTQILIALLKKHNINHVIVSPGMTNVTFVASIQNDPFFKLYSAVDERSAAYMACGLAFELGKPVALSCTGATASRNYVPALTEAYYRGLPILAITSSQPSIKIGHNIPQVTDRRHPMKDIVRLSVELPVVHCDDDEWACEINANNAMLELTKAGGGPVHINLISSYNIDFSEEKLPDVKPIYRIKYNSTFPELKAEKIAVFVGSHDKWSDSLINAVDSFCEKNNAVVLVDSTSNYTGKYRIFGNLVVNQAYKQMKLDNVDLLIHIGHVSGSYMQIKPKEVWRVSPDGDLCDTFRKLTYIFEMDEETFFHNYADNNKSNANTSYYQFWKSEYDRIYEKISDIPFSNAWLAYKTKGQLPHNSELHLGILNSLRCWNFFESDVSIAGYSNVGGFGIDGCISSFIGASLANPNKIYYCVVGDLAFFYDLNSLGNRHINNNIRLMLVNNGVGFEFKHFSSIPSQAGLQEEVDSFIAASGHYGKMSRELVKNYAENLGFEYLSASSKEEYLKILPYFTQQNLTEKPVLVEVFTNADDENQAQFSLTRADMQVSDKAKTKAKELIKGTIGKDNVKKLKSLLKKE